MVNGANIYNLFHKKRSQHFQLHLKCAWTKFNNFWQVCVVERRQLKDSIISHLNCLASFQFCKVIQEHKSGEMGNYTSFSCLLSVKQAFQKWLKSYNTFSSYSYKNVGDLFCETQCVYINRRLWLASQWRAVSFHFILSIVTFIWWLSFMLIIWMYNLLLKMSYTVINKTW